MPKMKTHRGAAKRMRVTGGGKIMRERAGRSHLLEKKSARRKRRLRRDTGLGDGQQRVARRMLGV